MALEIQAFFGLLRAKKVFSIEDDEQWHKTITAENELENLDISFVKTEAEYLEAISKHSGFDVIVIDGSHRDQCARYAVERLNQGGMLILDNSDWYPETAKFIRESLDVIQVDMKGFAPINFYTSTTSLFLHRKFNVRSREGLQPIPGIGSIEKR